jgi:hypothetical protein
MVSFRRIVLAIAMLALFVGLASAQVINPGGTSGGGNLVCTANVANPTQARAEGHTELLGDIVIACTGGSVLAAGSAVPTANFTVTLANTYVTSRQLSNGVSEALLLIDEPNAPIPASGPPAGAGFPFLTCTTAGGGASLVGAGAGGCPLTVGSATSTNPAVGTVYAAVGTGVLAGGSGTSSGVVNVFQGIVPAGSNQVIFNGVPILAPVSAGVSRVFRITNIRASAAQLGGGGTFQGTTSILAGITISNGLLVQSPVLTAANVFTGLTATVRNGANNGNGSSISTSGTPLPQCTSTGLSTSTTAAILRFTEGFASAFKTRVAPTAAYAGTATPANSILPVSTFTQNVPGFVYGGSESGFILPTINGTTGLADFGTRLKATFNNIPTGVTLFVTTTNVNPTGSLSTNTGAASNTLNTSGVPLNASNALLAGLVISESAGTQGVVSGSTGFLPLAAATNSLSAGNIQLVALTPDANGTATAVWEILEANPAAQEMAEFGVFYSVTGNQNAGTPPTSPAGTVSMSFAPTVSAYNGSTSIPRFAPSSTSSTFINVSLCVTEILFPFVNTTAGFDTGISIANTSADPQGSNQQTGPCTLNFYGSGAGTTTTSPFPSAGGNIAPGTINAEQISNIRNNFSGYIIAVCNFQLGHGFALFSDTGIRNWATSYLGLNIATAKRPSTTGIIEASAH